MLTLISKLWKEEKGQGMTEYALIIGIIAVAVIVALIVMRDKIKALFNGINFNQ